MKKLFAFSLILLAFFESNAQNPTAKPASADLNDFFKPLKWRNIGPFRGGRSVATSGVVGDPLTYYMGTTGGGLWKTDDAGQHWNNISDGYFKTGSVGAVEVAESDPNIVYCGMGEHAIRGVMTHHGDGFYKSTDAGASWKKTGLDATQHIAGIAIHPKNPDIVFVAAQGALYGKSLERGVYKSTDGGVTWKKVLYVNDQTGCSHISMDMNNPRIIYAAMWEHGRLPWKVISGGPGSGLYKSVDSGETWEKIHNGLPVELGKMSISVSRANSEKVYVLIESDSEKGQGGLFVSNNGGKNWSKVSGDNRLIQRAWYYIEVFADPQNEDMVYVLSAPALRSNDGGKTWEEITGTHGDFHHLWINPNNPKNLVIANDGGAAISFNRGKTWSTQDNMPTAQMYRIAMDNSFPYNIYGGQQDNTSVKIASQEFNSGGITNNSWTYSAGGESAFLAFDPDNPRYVLGGSYLGTIEILDTKAQAGTNIMAAPIQYLARETRDMKYRYNWNAPIIWSKHYPNTYYHAAQYLLRTQDFGQTWTEVSPDLTKNEKDKQGKGGGPYTNEAVGAENYGTISYVVASPHEKGVIWVGTDDGLVQITRDGGITWKNVTPQGLKECLVNAIDVSPHDPATAYIATTRYKFNDHTPALYKTTDYGKTWTNISKGIPQGAFTRVVREDVKRKGLLFAGTETGVFISWDGGTNWSAFQLNLPITPITDLMVKNNDLVAATSGRSYWILDDISLLRQFDNVANKFKVFQPEDAMLINGSSELNGSSPDFKGTNPLRGVNPATGAVIYYQLPDKDSSDVSIEIIDSKGALVRKFSSVKDTTFQGWDGGPPAEPTLSNKAGLNRFVWDLRHQTMPGVPGVYIEGSYRGHKAIPGKYAITFKKGTQSNTTSLNLLPNPNYSTAEAAYKEYHEFMSEIETTLTGMHKMVNNMFELRTQIEAIIKKLPEEEKYKVLKTQGLALINQMANWDSLMVQRKSKAYDDVENFENKLTANYLFLINHTESDIPRVTEPGKVRRKELDASWEALKTRANNLINKDVPAFNKSLWDAGVGAIMITQEKKP
jgi:photosystem II stability/assembly factor-like uncharacterized protein